LGRYLDGSGGKCKPAYTAFLLARLPWPSARAKERGREKKRERERERQPEDEA